MFKTFILGLILGIGGAFALVWYMPAVDLHREGSMISVQPNGGNHEQFHINLPQDRIAAGMQNENRVHIYPETLPWPDGDEVKGLETELFKVRNVNNAVVGVAARVSSSTDESGRFVQWMMHLPARGTLFANMQLGTSPDGQRHGLLVGGTREFQALSGNVYERFNKDVKDEMLNVNGRLELTTTLVGPTGDES